MILPIYLILLAAHGATDTAGTLSSSPRELTLVGDTVYFTADDGLHGRELWAVRVVPDLGTPYLAVDIEPGPASSEPTMLNGFAGNLYFRAKTSAAGVEPWVFEPAQKTARILMDIWSGPESSEAHLVGGDAQNLFIVSRAPCKLWAIHAGASALEEIAAVPRAEGELPWAMLPGGRLLLGAYDYLVVSDGSPRGTRSFRDMAEGGRFVRGIGSITALGAIAVLRGDDGIRGDELWRSDGTPEGTRLVKDIRPGPQGSGISQVFTLGTTAFFQANDGEHGAELWKTDGTPEGTVLVKDIAPGTSGSDPHYFAASGSYAFFVANNGANGKALWRSDGTADGTLMVGSINSRGVDIWAITSLGEEGIVFCAASERYGEEIFTMRRGNSPRVLHDIAPDSLSSSPGNLFLAPGHLLFTCDDGIHGDELCEMPLPHLNEWRLVGDIAAATPRQAPSSHPHAITASGENVVFAASDREHGTELWRSDGSDQGTALLKDILAGPRDSAPTQITSAGAHIFFTAQDDASGRELWVTSGEAASTRLVLDIQPGAQGSNPERLVSDGQGVYFTADDGVHGGAHGGARGAELWHSNGQAEGTQRVCAASGAIVRIFVHAGAVHFYTSGAQEDCALWRIEEDGAATCLAPSVRGALGEIQSAQGIERGVTASPPAALCWMYPPRGDAQCAPVKFGGAYYFQAQAASLGAELFRADETLHELRLVTDLYPGPAGSYPRCLTVAGPCLYFLADTPGKTRILWRTNGTAEGTSAVEMTLSGAGARPNLCANELIAADSHTLLAVATPDPFMGDKGQTELAIVDVSSGAGAYKIPLFPPVIKFGGQKQVRSIAVAGKRAFFACDVPAYGEELWVTDILDSDANVPARLVKDILRGPEAATSAPLP